MKPENIVKAAQGAAVGAALGTAFLMHQCIADDAARQNPPAPAESLIPCEVRDGILVCEKGSAR